MISYVLKTLIPVFVLIVKICLADILLDSPQNLVEGGIRYDVISVVKAFTSQIHNSLNVQKNGHLFYSLDKSNPLEIYGDDIDPLFNYYSDSNTTSNSTCLHDILYTLESFPTSEGQWAIRMIDSYGKPESGILSGNFKWLGDYNECVKVYAPPQTTHTNKSIGNFHGKYCTLQYAYHISSFALPLQNGVCIPDTCSPSELTDDFIKLLSIAKSIPGLNGTLLSNITSFLNSTSFTCKPTSKPLNSSAIAMIVLLSLFGYLALLGSSITVFEYFFCGPSKNSLCDGDVIRNYEAINDAEDSSQKDVLLHNPSGTGISGIFEKCKPFLKCFCIFTNGSKLLNTDATEGQLLCIHGIRFLSMSWVIVCHTFVFGVTQISNMLETATLIDNAAFEIIMNGFYSVDSFFVLSGFLLTYLFMQEYSKKKGKMSFLSWIYFYVHRYLRLTPVYMMVLGFASTIYLYLGSGPFWPDADVDPVCKKNWWWNLLYINNFQKTTDTCMGWSWYLANDMQFFIISPLFLVSLYKWPIIGCSLLSLFMCVTFFANFFITYHFDLYAGVISNISTFSSQHPDMKHFMDMFTMFFEKVYIKPYTRIGPYLVGIFLGYILFKQKVTNRPKLHKITLCCGWAIASAVTLACVYGLYDNTPTLIAACFYNGLNRTCFAAGLAWVIYVCLTDQGGFVNSILSYKLFIPLSRLTYCAYLIHPLIVTGYFAAMKTNLYYTHATLVTLFLGFLVVTYAFSLVVSVIFESPVIGLEKFVRSKFKSKRIA